MYNVGSTVKIRKKSELIKILDSIIPKEKFRTDWSIFNLSGQALKVKKIKTDGWCPFAKGRPYYILDDEKGTFAIDEFFETVKTKLDIILNDT